MRKRLSIKRKEPEIVKDEFGREYNAKTGRKIIRTFPKQQCSVPGCKRDAVGEVDVCERHGGEPLVKSNLMVGKEIPDVLRGKYKPEAHPFQYIQLSREGKSEVEIAAQFSVSVGTLRGWGEKFLEFHQAMEIGKAMYEAWWVQEGVNNLENRRYNTTLFKFLTGNKLGWSDKIESKSMNIHAGVLLVPGQMDKDEWEKTVKQQHEKEEDVIDV
jgi:hypothetical protein